MAFPTAPSVEVAATSHNFLTTSAAISILKPEIDPEFTRRYGDQNMCGLIDQLGGKHQISNIQYSHYEDTFLHTILKVDAQGGGGANASVNLTVLAGYQYTYSTSAQAPYIVASNTVTNPVQINQILRFPAGVIGRVTAVNYSTGVFAVSPIVLGESIPATTTSTEIVITNNSWDEASGQPLSRSSGSLVYTNNAQIFKWTNESSGTSLTEMSWFQVPTKNGMSWAWAYKGQFDEYLRGRNEREMGLLTNKKTTNTTLAAISGQTTNVTTEGLIPGIENNGNTYNYSLITGITLADFTTMIQSQLDKNRGARENSMWNGINLQASIEDFIRDATKNGGISYGAFGGDQKKYINFGFNSFAHLNYTFHTKVYDVFNYPQGLGAAGHNYVNMGLILPMDKQVMSVGPEKTRVSVPFCRMNYMGLGNYSREWEEFPLGGVNGIYTNGTDNMTYNMRSHVGFELFAANRCVKVINS